jgi:hypothetical protein
VKWFFGLNEGSLAFEGYESLIKVAVHTALKETSLEPYFIYDGSEGALVAWMRARGVTVLQRRTFLYDRLQELARERDNPRIVTIGSGAYLRLEIPQLTQELGFDDEFALYTDCDVMFLRDVSPLESLRPRFFAVAPQHDPADWNAMNSGVMVMNLPALRRADARFRPFVRRFMEQSVPKSWDQAAYRRYYGRGFAASWLPALQPRWDKLPIEYNWKTYWDGDWRAARILHLHGPKPHTLKRLQNGESLPPGVSKLITPTFYEVMEDWQRLLAEADASVTATSVAPGA